MLKNKIAVHGCCWFFFNRWFVIFRATQRYTISVNGDRSATTSSTSPRPESFASSSDFPVRSVRLTLLNSVTGVPEFGWTIPIATEQKPSYLTAGVCLEYCYDYQRVVPQSKLKKTITFPRFLLETFCNYNYP